MKIYLKDTVFDAALQRIRWLFDEFEHVIVDFSGGKDSTVMVNLALRVAEEKNRLPLEVLFIDQEAEWRAVIDYVQMLSEDPRLNFRWLQIPIRLFNATSTSDPWLFCWDPGKESEWIRAKSPNSIHDNIYGTDRFKPLFPAYAKTHYPDAPACHISGVRCEESPARLLGLTSYETYKGETWGRVDDKALGHYTMYPIYDWSYTDVWKAIHDNGWPYCRIYDCMYQYGVPVHKMRVSNVHHETAVDTLFYLQEVEADTWERVTRRIAGINTAGHLQEQWHAPKTLPPMFRDWREYRDHLLENLIETEERREVFRRQFESYERLFVPESHARLIKAEIDAILTNDYHGTKLNNFRTSNMRFQVKRGKISGRR